MTDMTDETGVQSAKALYESLVGDRQTALDMARECSKLTIPSLLPPDGTNNSTILAQPYQSLGAYGVNNLAAKLLMALYPPGNAFFRYVMPEPVANEAQATMSPDQQSEMQKTLASIENRVIQKFEASTVRPQKAESLMHLVVAGNVLTKFDSLEEFRMFRLDQYVCRRNAAGKPMDVVIKERVPTADLEPDVRVTCGVKENDKTADVYTAVCWEDGKCKWRQEINEIEVPDSDGSSPEDKSPWNPLRWKAVPGSDYGRGHCEEYVGDLQSLEGLSQSNVEYAALCAKVVLLVKPGSTTNVEDINRARSGDAVAGNEDDVHAFQLDKYADFKVVEMALQRLEERLSRAFLVRSGMIRQAERVTAEEIRDVAQELEDTLGGVYTVLAQEEQMPFIRRLLAVLETERVIPRLPANAVQPVVVTGFQALGRNHSLNKLRGAIQDLVNIFGPEGAMQILQPSDVATRIFLGWGVEDTASVIKSGAQIAQERADAQKAAAMQTLMEKGTAPAVAGAMKSVAPSK
jgi:hypothetical protein